MVEDIVLFQLGNTVTLECKSEDLEICLEQPPRKPVIQRVEAFKADLDSERENECIKDLL